MIRPTQPANHQYLFQRGAARIFDLVMTTIHIYVVLWLIFQRALWTWPNIISLQTLSDLFVWIPSIWTTQNKSLGRPAQRSALGNPAPAFQLSYHVCVAELLARCVSILNFLHLSCTLIFWLTTPHLFSWYSSSNLRHKGAQYWIKLHFGPRVPTDTSIHIAYKNRDV